MKKFLRKLTSFAMALFMVLQVMLPAFATKSKAEEENPNSIKSIENLNPDDETYFSITDSQKIYDKKKIKKDESKFSIAIGLPDTSSNFKLVKRNDLKLYDDKLFPTNEEASKEYWRVKDMLNDQGLDTDLEIIKEDQGYRIINKENLENEKEEKQYGENYSYINFKILDDFDFNEKGNQKLLNQEKLVFNLEFITNISPDPNYNLFEKDEDGKWKVKNEGDIFALVNADKVNVYDTSFLTNDLNSLESYKEEKTQAEEKAKKEAEEKKKAKEEAKKKEEEKKLQEEIEKAEAEKKAQEEKEKAEAEKKTQEIKKAEEEKKAQDEAKEKSQAENKENSKNEKSVLELENKYKKNQDEKSSDQKSITEKKQDKPEESLTMTNLEKADKELKEALKDENNSIGDIQKLLTNLGEKYKLSRLDQEKLMSDNDKAIRDFVEKDRKESFRALMLRQGPPTQSPSDSFDKKVFNLKTKMNVKASPAWPIPSGWYFDVYLGPYLKKSEQIKDLTYKGQTIARGQYIENGNDDYIRYTYISQVNDSITLDIDQNLAFDTDNIKDKDPIDVNIRVAPKNNPVQSMPTITVKKDATSPVESSFTVNDKGETQSETYPYQLDWKTTSQKLKLSNGKEVEKMVDLDKGKLAGAYVEWDIEVNTSALKNNKLEFGNLNLTVFGSSKQGIKNFEYTSSFDQGTLGTNKFTSSDLGEVLSANSTIAKNDIGDTLYIKVKGYIDPDDLHDTYSIGFRINPDSNYIKKLLEDVEKKYQSIPTPIKWLRGVEDARRFANLPFNLVETNIPATFLGLSDNFTNERSYFDTTRTIVSDRVTENKTNWYALDLLRRGEKQDPALDNPEFYRVRNNNPTDNDDVKLTKVFYLPLLGGGYKRTYQAGEAIMENGEYFPGTLVSYEYLDQKGGRNDTYYLEANLRQKKVANVDESYQTTGGNVALFTERVSDQKLIDSYLVYTENPYPIMRINKNFDLVACFNQSLKAPVYDGKKGVFLDIHEDPSGEYLLSRLTDKTKIEPKLKNVKAPSDPNKTLSESEAMEDLMKRIYFYANEVKKEYPASHNGKEMHRLIESSMIQRVVHNYTDGIEISQDYFTAPSDYNEDSWKFDHTLTGIKKTYPQTGWDGQFEGTDNSRTTDDGLRRLKDNEDVIGNTPPVQSTQYKAAEALLKKVQDSYNNQSWTKDKADSVKLVFYSHTDDGKWQELITGRVMEPIKIDKFDIDGKTRLPGAKFTFTNISTGKTTTWTSKEGNESDELYLRPGTYRVTEEAPEGYVPVKDFTITVKREEINGDNGPYRFKGLPRIHVNDGFKTVVEEGKDIPKASNGEFLVKLDEKNIKLSITNEKDNLGTLEFTKKNKFRNLDGARFSLTKLDCKTVAEAKGKLNTNTFNYDFSYRRISAGTYGEFKFEQIPEGIYILEELDAPAGYKKAKKYILEAKEQTVSGKDKVVVKFTEEKDPTKEGYDPNVIERADGSIDLINEPKDTEITIRKIRQEYVKDTKTEHLGLNDAKFRLISINTIDGDFYFKEGFTNRTEPIDDDKVDEQNARGGGYLTFDKIKIGEYLLQELQAPKGYKKTSLYGWKLVVSEVKETDEATGKKKGDLEYKLYKVKKQTDINNTNLEEVKLDDIIKGDKKVKAFQIGNEARKKDIAFDKYLSDGTGSNDLLKPEYKELRDKDGNPISFNLYKADYYGAIVDNKPINEKPIVQNCFRKPDDIPEKYRADEYKYKFVLEGMEFGGYYVLREMNPPKDYKESSDILLKIEAEAVASEGQMKVVVRDPNTNAYTNEHSMLLGVVNYKKEAKLGEFSIKKVGNAIGYTDDDGNPIRVGLRRAYFRLYKADENFEIKYKDKDKKYPEEYIQKVTPGVPITHEDANGKQVGTDPKDLPKNQGIVTFDQLKPGNYVLEEYRGPAGYEKDPGKWYIKVDEFGTVTKYRENPATSTSPRTVDYSTQSLRYKTFGLDKSEPLQFNRLMSQTTGSNLEAFEYDASIEDLNVKVKASKVTRNDGERTINLRISPKEKQVTEEQIIGNNIKLVFVLDRSKDLAAGARTSSGTIDQNINKLISDIVEKAKKSNANIDATFIEYDNKGNAIKGGVNQDLLALDKSITTSQTYNMKTPSNMTGEDVVIKDYLSALKIKSRSTSNADGNKALASNRDSYYSQIIKTNKNYDKRLLIDISNFATASAQKWNASNIPSRPDYKYYAAEILWPFRDHKTSPHFDTWLVHVDQVRLDKNSDPNVKGYSDYMSNNTANDINGTPLPDHFNHILNTSNYNSNGVNTFKDYFDKQILTDDNFIKERKTVVKPADNTINNASLEISLGYYINLLSSIAKIGNKELEKQASLVKKGTKKYIKLDGIDLKNGETLDFTYTINLISDAKSKGSYTISNSTKFNNSNISMQYANGKTIDTERVNGDNPVGNRYAIIVNPTSGGSVTASKYLDIAKDEPITLTATPDEGFKLESIIAFKDDGGKVDLNKFSTRSLIQTEAPSTYTFTMPESNVSVTANFTKIPQGDITLYTRFTYTNQKGGVDDSEHLPNNNQAGKIRLQVKKDGSEVWEYVGDEQIAPAKGNLTFNNLEASKEYRFEYKKDAELAKAWGSEVTTYIPIDISKPDANKTVKMTISNGNLMEIFNHDETGFRIPLRISKVNENKGALTGSQFKARKLIDGDEANIYEKDSDGKYKVVGRGLPKYAKEPFDAVSEATGEPGDNYFRELSPGIYELEEINAPGTLYRLPTDKNGNPMKWYFKVFVNENKLPSEADYMGITFDFDYTFTDDSKFNKGLSADKIAELKKIGKIEGLTRKNPDFNKYVEEIKDDGRSNPARPDAPYKWIHDVQVTNYKNTTELKFFKKDAESRQNLSGAEFSLEKVLLGNNKEVQFNLDGSPKIDPKFTTLKQTSDDKLGVNFEELEEGTYVLKETKAVTGYAPNDSFLLIKFKIADDGSWTQEVKAYKKDSNNKYVEITDEKEKSSLFHTNGRGELLDINNNKNYIDLKFRKIKSKKVDGKEVGVVTSAFVLTKVDENKKEIEDAPKWKEIFHINESNFEFKNLEVGHYKLEETWAITEYEKPDPWYFDVEQDDTTHKLKIVFKKEGDLTVRFTPINNTADGKKTPKLDSQGNPEDLRIVNFERTSFTFQKLKNEVDKKGNKLPLIDAFFNMRKVRDSMDSNSRTYEYHDNRVLKIYNNRNRITEYYDTGVVKTFEDKVNKKTYHYNEQGELTKVNTSDPTDDDKKVKPDSITSATGKFNEISRSQTTGSVNFSNLGQGIYVLEEIGIPEGYESEYNQFKWIFKVKRSDDGLKVVHDKDLEKQYFETYDKPYYDKVYSKLPQDRNIEVSNDGGYAYKITNTKTVTDLKWKKIYDKNTSNLMNKVTKFTLFKKSGNPNEDIKTAIKGRAIELPLRVESTNGQFEITDLSKGIYVLNETQTPQGYKKMTRSIVIKIYEDLKDNGTLKKQFYEAYEKGNDIELVSDSNNFENLIKGDPNTGKVLTDTEGNFFVNNESKPYFFYVSKGILDKGKFKDLTKGKLKLRLKADPEDTTNTDTKEYITTIDLSEASTSYKIDANGVELGKRYILEEIEAPDGYRVNGKKYYLTFTYNTTLDQKFVATIVKIVDRDGNELTTTDDNKTINKGYMINQSQPFRIVNEKTEVEFLKVGINEDNPNGKPLNGVKFYLEKQDPRDVEKPNLGYYPVTEDMEYIKSEVGKDNKVHYYIEKEDGTPIYDTGGLFPKEITEENSRYEFSSKENGKLKIENLVDGLYRIKEPEAAKDGKDEYMKVSGPVKRFRVENGKVLVYTKDKNDKLVEKELTSKNVDTLGKIVNRKEGKGEFTLEKVDEKGDPLADVSYTLHETDVDEKIVGEEKTTDKDGKIIFKNLPFGYYWLKETKTKDGYIIDTKKKLISLGGGEWKVPSDTSKTYKDVSKAITFDGKQAELVSTEDSKRKDVVYPNKAEGMFAKFKFKIDPDTNFEAGDYFTIHFSDNVDLDGILTTNTDENGKVQGKMKDSKLNIIGPGGLLAEAKIGEDRRSITYTFTNYVDTYKPSFMEMYVQLFANRKEIRNEENIEVAADIGTDKTRTDNYQYKDTIKIDYRGLNSNGKEEYNGYQNPKADVSSYTLRLNPDGKTFTAIIYYNPWNKQMQYDKRLTFKTNEDIKVNENLSVKTYIKSGSGSHASGWVRNDLPDSYEIDPEKDNLTLISDTGDPYNWYPTKVWTETKEVNYYDNWDYWQYDSNGYPRYYKKVRKDNRNEKLTRQIDIPSRFLNRKGDPNNSTYVIEIKGELNVDAKSLTTRSEQSHYNYRYSNGATYKDTYNSHFETWSQFFNPGGIGGVNKTVKLLNHKNKIEFVKVDGGVKSNVVDKEVEDPLTLKKLGIGETISGAKFKLQKQDGNNWQDVLKPNENVIDEKTSDQDGIFSWEGLAPGDYRVIETQTANPYLYNEPEADKELSTFTVNGQGNIVDIKNEKNVIENYKKSKITIMKTDQEGKTLEGAKFYLAGEKNADGKTNKDPTYIDLTRPTGKDGKVTFDKLPAGKYTLEETEAPAGYTKSKQKWNLEVSRDGRIKWTNSFDDTGDKMKAVTGVTYTGNDEKNLTSEILGIDKEAKTFRQKITIKAKPNEIKNARLILDSVDKSLKLTQFNTKVRLVKSSDGTTIDDKDAYTTYKVETDNGTNPPHLTLTITPPHKAKETNKPVGTSNGQTDPATPAETEKEQYYQFIVDMPYKDDTRIGAKATYDLGTVDETTGKVTFDKTASTTSLDKYVAKSNYTVGKTNVDMTAYKNGYLDRDINLITTTYANIKQPDIYFKKVDADKPDKALAGAEFELQKKFDEVYAPVKKDGTKVTLLTEKWKESSDENGHFGFSDIPDGDYQIVETKAPDGYALVQNIVFKFKVENGKIEYIVDKKNNIPKNGLEFENKKTEVNSEDNRILITNKKAQYPSTGGPGVWIGFTVIGMLVMFVAVLTYWKRRDKLRV